MMKLFAPFQLGNIELKNRIVMAPMTRCRAVGGVANELMRDYYSARAGAGLLITEGIAPAANGMGYARIPGLYNDEQAKSFRQVTDAVHDKGGRIFAQLMHVGRIGHTLNLPAGAKLIAPSAVRAQGDMWTDQEAMQPLGEPEALTADGIVEVQEEFVRSARLAIEAGFDGVELHAANGYLLTQFLHPHTNRRTDEYGGDEQSRARMVLEIAAKTVAAIGAERVGMRLSPYSTFNDLPDFPQEKQYQLLAQGLKDLCYLHIVGNPHEKFASTAALIKKEYGGPIIANGGYNAEKAEAALTAGQADLISFGSSYLANPDLVERMKTGAKLNVPDPTTFYSPGAEGYVDYPTLGA